MSTRPTIAELRARVDIPTAWRWLGLPNPPAKPGLCRSPFREDRRPSFSICHSGSGFRDHATNETGDVLTFIRLARGCTNAEAVRILEELAGCPPPPVSSKGKATTPPHKWPHELRRPSVPELFRLKELRDLPNIAGLELLIDRGLLWTGTAHDCGDDVEAWILADTRQHHARRLDGKPWGWSGSKSWCKAGADIGLPLGIDSTAGRSHVVILEGGPDLIAAACFAWTELPEDVRRIGLAACMSSTVRPTPAALATLRGKRVRIVPHSDANNAGRRWAAAWIPALEEAGCMVDVWDLRPLEAGDLCDLSPRYTNASTPPDDYADNHQLPEGLRLFADFL